MPANIATAPERDHPGGSSRLASVALVVAIGAAIIGGSTMWLLVTEPVTVASAVEAGDISPLVRQLAQVIYDALAGLLNYV